MFLGYRNKQTDINKASLYLDGRGCSSRGGLSPPTLESILGFLFFCCGFRAGAHSILVLVAPPTTGRGFPDSSVSKESASNAGDPDSIPGSGRSAGEGIGYPLQYSWASLVALQCGRPGFDSSVGKIPWRREKLPTPVFWPREFHVLYSPWDHEESDTTERLSPVTGTEAHKHTCG